MCNVYACDMPLQVKFMKSCLDCDISSKKYMYGIVKSFSILKHTSRLPPILLLPISSKTMRLLLRAECKLLSLFLTSHIKTKSSKRYT